MQHLEQPVLIYDNLWIRKLPEDLNKIGVTYINDVYLKIQEEFPRILNTIANNKGIVNTYVGVGITKEDINYVIIKEEQNMKMQIKKDLIIYKQMQNQKTTQEISKWLTTKQQVYPLTYYKELEQTIKDYEKEQKAKYDFKHE